MGKYDADELSDKWVHSTESQYLEFIANELAESNRLKRIEIFYNNTKHMEWLMKHKFAKEKDLEDKA